MNEMSRCGYIAIIGRPNVGKSTLLNALLQKKLSITSDKPQTTRFQILGIKTRASDQAIYIDTPGIHKVEKKAINRYMNRLASSVILDADVILFMIEALKWTDEDELVLTKLAQSGTNRPVILIINKIDNLKDKGRLLPFIESIQTKYSFTDIFPIAAIKPNDVLHLEEKIMSYLPEGPHLFPDDQITDKNERFQAAEIVREKLIRATGQEIPYCATVVVENMEREEKLIRIQVVIWVERDGQKAIIIGKDGEKLKQIGTAARKDLEKLFNEKVFLRLWVKIKDDWSNDDRALKSLGYI